MLNPIHMDKRRYSPGSRSMVMIAGVLSTILIPVIAGWACHRLMSDAMNMVQERSIRIHCLTQVNEIEKMLETCRQDLIYLSKNRVTPKEATAFLEYQNQTGVNFYKELIYIGQADSARFLLWNTGTEILTVAPGQWGAIEPDPMAFWERLRSLQPGHVYVSDIFKTVFSMPLDGNRKTVSAELIRLAVTCVNETGNPEGYLIFGIDMLYLRNILSLYNSNKSPLHAFPQSPGRISYLFDLQGWILFESGNIDDPATPLSTSRVQTGLTGVSGKSGHKNAFLPDGVNPVYWKMVSAVQSGHHSLYRTDQQGKKMIDTGGSHWLVYAPILFKSRPDKEAEIHFGLAVLDRSGTGISELLRPRYVFLIITISIVIVLIASQYFFLVAFSQSPGQTGQPPAGIVPEAGIEHGKSESGHRFLEKDIESVREGLPENTTEDADRVTARTRCATNPADNSEIPENGAPGEFEIVRQTEDSNSGLGKRQQTLFAVILERGGISGQEYRELLGDGFSNRAAKYDLDMMVKKGYLKKKGKGKSAQYSIISPFEKL